MVRPKSNNSNAVKKRLAPRRKRGVTITRIVRYKVTGKSDRTIPRAIQRPELNVEKNQTIPPIKPANDTKGTPSIIRKKPA